MRSPRRSNGFTLVELLAAAAVCAIALVAAAKATLESSDLQRSNAQTRGVGPMLASLIDEVRATPIDDMATTWSGTSKTCTGLADCAGVATATYTVTDAAGTDPRWPLKQVKVVLTWQGLNGPQRAWAVTYVADRLGTGVDPLGVTKRGANAL